MNIEDPSIHLPAAGRPPHRARFDDAPETLPRVFDQHRLRTEPPWRTPSSKPPSIPRGAGLSTFMLDRR